MIKVSLEFQTVEEAILALGRMIVEDERPVPAVTLEKEAADRGETVTQLRGKDKRKNNGGARKGAGRPRKTAAPQAQETAGIPSGGPGPVASTDGESAAPAVAAAPTPEVHPAAADERPGVTKEMIEGGVEKLFNTKGYKATLGLLQRNGVSRVRDIKPEAYSRVMDEIEALLVLA